MHVKSADICVTANKSQHEASSGFSQWGKKLCGKTVLDVLALG